MQILTKSKNLIKIGMAGGSAAALIAGQAAFAHGFSGSYSAAAQGPQGGHVQTAAKLAVNSDNDSSNNNNGQGNWNKQMPNCTQLQQNLNQQAASIKARDQKQLNGLNIMLDGIQTYVSSGGVTVNNYTSMNAQATTDQTTATNVISAISAPQLNCDDPSGVGSQISSFKASLKTIEQDLHNYRNDVMQLFNASINGTTNS